MEALEVPEHEHPLKLIDLQLEYIGEEEEEDDDDDDGDPIVKEGFHGATCGRCGEEIYMYHRYFYKCMGDSSCDFSLHKFCAELSRRLDHTLHRHSLIQHYMTFNWSCRICKGDHTPLDMCYGCYECSFHIDVNCVVEVGKKMIHHPCHPHLLICAISQPILCNCKACGKEHKGIFYQCTTCNGFTIHSECAFLPEKLLIQQTTDGAFHHIHPLTISYSFPIEDQRAKYFPTCRVCGDVFYDLDYLWICKCDKCMYYAHLDCAIRVPPHGLSKTIKNFDEADHPGLVHFPFPDETYSVPKHYFFQQTGPGMFIANDEVSLQHISHEHPLILVDTQSHGQTSSSSSQKINSWLLMCHNPMKKTQLLCNGCVRPIMSTMPFYICEHKSCKFALHEWCTRLPPKIENHTGHPQHTLLLRYSNVLPHMFFGVFHCEVCTLPCNGFAYCCVECEYIIDVSCGFMPKEITHKAHLNHFLSLVQELYLFNESCIMCHQRFWQSSLPPKPHVLYNCNVCDIYMHPACAFLIPEAIRHKYDEHPMHLSYLPIQNHKSKYLCEICEEDLNPHKSFYHCQDCAQSVHTTCAPLILQCETETYRMHLGGVHLYANIKFGGIYNTHGHPHPLSFAQGTVLDGQCIICDSSLQYGMIFKCFKCKFAVHYHCLNNI